MWVCWGGASPPPTVSWYLAKTSSRPAEFAKLGKTTCSEAGRQVIQEPGSWLQIGAGRGQERLWGHIRVGYKILGEGWLCRRPCFSGVGHYRPPFPLFSSRLVYGFPVLDSFTAGGRGGHDSLPSPPPRPFPLSQGGRARKDRAELGLQMEASLTCR